MQSEKIDSKYYINVADKMIEKGILPRPRKRLFAIDEHMPIITIECET